MMAQLEVYLKNERIEKVSLNNHELLIGRRPENDIVLHDLTVSRLHARLRYVPEGRIWQVENMSVTNPVRLNGEIVEKPEVLFDGDHLAVGTYTLIFHYGKAPELPPIPQELANDN